MKYFRIRDWAKHFENNRTRELKRMEWVPVPNKHDGDGFTELLDHPNGMAHYGAWHLILQVASKCDPRGTLLRDSRTLLREGAEGSKSPHTAASLARVTRGDVRVFDEAIPRLLSIGWLELYDNPALGCDNPAPSCGEVPMEWNGTEGNGIGTHTHPSQAEVRAKASLSGIPEEVADRFWHHYESSGWIDKNGHPILKWQSKLITWASDERARPIEEAHHAKPNHATNRSQPDYSKGF